MHSSEAPSTTYKEIVAWCMDALRNTWFVSGGDKAYLAATDLLMEFGTCDIRIARSGMWLLSILSLDESARKCVVSHVDARLLKVAMKCMANVGDCMESANDSVEVIFNLLREQDFIDGDILLGFLNHVIGSFCLSKFKMLGSTDTCVSNACRSVCRLRKITKMSNVNQYLQVRGLLVISKFQILKSKSTL
jgi:hypothetical protein